MLDGRIFGARVMLASGGMSRRLSNLMKNLAIILREISEKNILKVFLFRGVPENPSKSIGLRKWLLRPDCL